MRMRSLPRPRRGPLLQARLALYLLHLEGAASGRDQPGVFPRRGCRRRPLGHPAPAAQRSRTANSRGDWLPGRRAALELDDRLRAGARFQPIAAGTPELDIVVWKVQAELPGAVPPALPQRVFDACAARNLHLALVQLPQRWFRPRRSPLTRIPAKSRDLPAIGTDEARARSLAGPYLAGVHGSLPGNTGRVERWQTTGIACESEKKTFSSRQATAPSPSFLNSAEKSLLHLPRTRTFGATRRRRPSHPHHALRRRRRQRLG